MRLSTKVVSILSSAALVAALAAGCSAGEAKPTPAPRPDYIPEDIVQYAAGISKDTPLVIVDGAEVPAEQVLYWAAYTADQLGQYTGGLMDWSMDMGDGTTMKDYLLTNAIESAKLYQVIANHAKEMKIDISGESKKTYDEDLAAMKTSLAGQVGAEDQELTYAQWLGNMGLSEAGFSSINQVSYLFRNIRDSLYGEKGKEAPTEEALAAWAEENGMLRASHILVKAVPSADGADDGMAAALEKANTIRAELKAAGDTAEKFEALKKQYSEDVNPGTGEQNCPPEGYTFGPGEMVPQFEEGTKALTAGQVGEPVQSDFGYHIIMRLDVQGSADMKESYANEKMDALVDEWVKAAQVEKTEACDTVDLEAYYTKLGELRTVIGENMFPAPEETPAPSAPAESGAPAESAEPTPTPAG